MTETTKIKGKIILAHKNGYGFITSPDKPFVKFFFHWTALPNDGPTFDKLYKSMNVEFKPVMNFIDDKGKDCGPRALEVNVIKGD